MEAHIGQGVLAGRHGGRTRHFLHHLAEMTAAMLLGMCVLGLVFRQVHIALFGSGFDDAWHRHTELAVFAMTFNMTLPMVAWMRHRGHSWRRSGEMAAAMFVLALALLGLFWARLLSAHSVLPLEMALMFPAMVVAMLHRLGDYSEPYPARPAVRSDGPRPMRSLLESISGAAQIAVHFVLYPFLQGWRRRWGTTRAERALRLPGDELVPEPEWTYDHAVSIRAPRSAVWPWLVQLGQGRGGFYSYEGLENVAGCRIHNVQEIRPELQELHVGDTVVTHGRSGFGPPVTRLEPERALVLGGPPNKQGSRSTWSFHLLDGPAGTTRLLERGRAIAGKGPLEKLAFGPYLVDPIGFVMSKKMLRTIKGLAQASEAGENRGHS